MMAEVILMTKVSMIAVCMSDDSFVNRLPWIDVKITLRTTKTFICKLDQVHQRSFTTIMQLKLGKNTFWLPWQIIAGGTSEH